MRLALALALCGLVACRPAHDPDTLRKLEERITILEQGKAREDRVPGVDPNASFQERVERLEGIAARYADALEFLRMVYEQQKQAQDAAAESEHDPDAMFAVDVTKAVKAGQVEGPATAAVTIVKAFDFACPHCQRMNATLHDVVKEYKGKVRVVFLNLVVHPDTALTAHKYSCAAAKQKQYLAWKDAFWDKGFGVFAASGGRNLEAMQEPAILAFSKDLKLDLKKLEAEAKSEACTQRLDEDAAELVKFKVNGTPALFFNGTFIGGAIPLEEVRKLVDEKLKEVNASGVPSAQYYDKVVMTKGLKQFRSKRDAKR